MSGPAALAAALAGLALGGYALYRYLMGILVRNLLSAPEMHLDFSATEVPGPQVQEQGRPEAPLVLFFHEYAATGASSAKYCGFLTEAGYRIMAPDFPATDPRGPRVFPSDREVEAGIGFVAAAREAAGDRPWVGFGVSRGAATLLLALDRSRPSGSLPGGWPAALVLDSFGAAPDLVELLIRRFAPIYIGPIARLLPGPFVRFTARRGLAAAGAQLGTGYPDPVPALATLPMPKLLIHGSRDRAIPASLVPGYLAAAGPGAEALVIEGARHNGSVVTDPRTYAARVLAHCARAGAGPGTR